MTTTKQIKTKTIGTRVDKETYQTIERMAQKENRTISNLIGIWIADRLSKEIRRAAQLKKASNQ